jgi:hypothetical protein
MRKYNDCLKGMVDNYREKATASGLSTDKMSDEEVFEMIERNRGSTAEEDLEWFLDDLRGEVSS